MTQENTVRQGFRKVEQQRDDPARFFRILDVQAGLPAVVALRGRALSFLDPAPGRRFVDVGCGTGEVARAIAGRVAPGGAVVGLDASDVMIAEAVRRTPDGTPVEFRLGDALALDFPDGSLDGVHCERVLQHVVDPDRALAEFVRVTKPGGRVVVVDTDWDTAVIDGPSRDVERRIRHFRTDEFAHGTVGRRLYAMCRRAGLDDVQVGAESLIFTEWDDQAGVGPPIGNVIRETLNAGRITQSEADDALASISVAAKEGAFFFAVTVFLCSGTRP